MHFFSFPLILDTCLLLPMSPRCCKYTSAVDISWDKGGHLEHTCLFYFRKYPTIRHSAIFSFFVANEYAPINFFCEALGCLKISQSLKFRMHIYFSCPVGIVEALSFTCTGKTDAWNAKFMPKICCILQYICCTCVFVPYCNCQ